MQAWLISILKVFAQKFLVDVLNSAYEYLKRKIRKKEIDHAVKEYEENESKIPSEADQKKNLDRVVSSTNKPEHP